MSQIIVVAEHRQGELRECTLEALGAALTLAEDLGGTVTTVLLAENPESLSADLKGRSPNLRLVSHPDLRNYNPELYLPILEDVIKAAEPSVVMMAHTSQGMDLGPALAGRLGLPLVTDCSQLSLKEGRLTAGRQVYGGKIVERLLLKPAPTTVITLQGGAFEPPEIGVETTAEQIVFTDLAPRHHRRFLDYVRAELEDVDIAAADILVSVGRGIGEADNVARALELAEAIGASLSCSRPVADAGWLPKSRQVGTTGKTVRPKVYIALGISGSFQHVAGMKGSGAIIAVNKDPRAPIFQVAHYGLVADIFEVLPQLVEQFKG